MATLPTPFIWGDDLFAADPIQQGPFEAGLGACDWTADNLNGALYMLSSWMVELTDCVSFATAADVLMGSNPDSIITVGVFDLALCAALFRKGGQTFSADCGTALPATGTDGDVFLVLNAAGDAVVSVHLWGDGAWNAMTVGEGTCIKCVGGDTWCLNGGVWAIGSDSFNLCLDTPEATQAQVDALKDSDRIAVCVDGIAVRVRLDDLGLPAPSGDPVGPFTAGQNPEDWVFSGGNISVLPSGPSGVAGYWHLEASFNDGTLTVGPVSSSQDDANFVGQAGASVSFTASLPGGSYTGMRGHWVKETQ